MRQGLSIHLLPATQQWPIKYQGRIKYLVYPDIFSPVIVPDSVEVISRVDFKKGGSFLEIGAGCGLISFAAYFEHGMKEIVGTDIV